ncbi:hypothetical protein HDU89_001796 [Geranomyces variabilis]|nr:hypothetical protein HDU89_001796 [Geranomyces variabilis]
MAVAAAASGISSLHILATGGTQCTAAQPSAAGAPICSDPIAIQPGTDASLVWTWTPAANATIAGDASPATFFLQDAQSEIVVAENVDATTQQVLFRIPVSPLLQGNVTIGVIQDGRRVTTASPATALAAAQGGAGGASIAHIALILGLCSVFGLALLLASFFGWRNWVRRRPGYARRKQQRTKGFSTVVVTRVKHFWNDSLLRSIGRRGGATQHSTCLADKSPHDDSNPVKTSRLTDIAVQPPQPCFRPSSDLLPPRLVRTYTWQEADTNSQANMPLPHMDGEEHMLLPLRHGWDEGPSPSDPDSHSNSCPVIAHK